MDAAHQDAITISILSALVGTMSKHGVALGPEDQHSLLHFLYDQQGKQGAIGLQNGQCQQVVFKMETLNADFVAVTKRCHSEETGEDYLEGGMHLGIGHKQAPEREQPEIIQRMQDTPALRRI